MNEPEAGEGRAGDSGKPMAGCANVAAAMAMLLWATLFFRAADHYAKVAAYGYPEMTGAWDTWVWLPLGIAVGLLVAILVFNFVLRSAPALLVLTALAWFMVLPYLIATSGGV